MSEYSSHREQVCNILDPNRTGYKHTINSHVKTPPVCESNAGEMRMKFSRGRSDVCAVEGRLHPVHTSASIGHMPWFSTLHERYPPPNVTLEQGTGTENVSWLSRRPEMKLYRCMVCKAAFRDMYNLGKHVFAHMEEDEPCAIKQTYKCNLCPKVFTQLSSLNAHLYIHRTFCCEICKKGFTQKSSLAIHFGSARHKRKAEEHQKICEKQQKANHKSEEHQSGPY